MLTVKSNGSKIRKIFRRYKFNRKNIKETMLILTIRAILNTVRMINAIQLV